MHLPVAQKNIAIAACQWLRVNANAARGLGMRVNDNATCQSRMRVNANAASRLHMKLSSLPRKPFHFSRHEAEVIGMIRLPPEHLIKGPFYSNPLLRSCFNERLPKSLGKPLDHSAFQSSQLYIRGSLVSSGSHKGQVEDLLKNLCWYEAKAPCSASQVPD
ncbi:hypothetical protein CEXT_575981 [Caerostris extrusa]|uniref:Uncharacterized protein n=1 Tax=Caerostris extrusa TaxID=172846 RepID=A0AAV4MS78_CAEEX|nr:hypothetical protein CEXT_575981 [Caerostris extrusa]